jgi:ABC-type oligopeptide transport system substrate-binding subunit
MRNTRTHPTRACLTKSLRAIARLSEEVEELKRQILLAEQAQEKNAATKSDRRVCLEDFTITPAILQANRRAQRSYRRSSKSA